MRIIFFGLGSIGRRHARLLSRDYDHDLFAYRTHKGPQETGENLGEIREVGGWDEVREIKPDIAFITNPTFLHIETAIKCASLGIKLFIEKPIDCSAQKLDLLLEEIAERQLVTYVAYNLRFHPVIVFLKKYIESKKVNHVSVRTSSYLPSWHPGHNYAKSHSAWMEKGGGVILELSHEFDYIKYLFGDIENIDGVFGKVSGIIGDGEDFMDAIIKTDQTCVNLHLNFLSFQVERTIKIDCEDEFISVDLSNSKIEFITAEMSTTEEYSADRDDSYRRQIRYFFDNIENNRMMNNLSDASVLFKKILEFRDKSK